MAAVANHGKDRFMTSAEDAAASIATPPSARTRVRRLAENARYERATVHAIIDAAFVCHVAFADADGVHCIPTVCWRIGEHLHVHGSNGSRMLRALAAAEAAVTVTHLDGLVLARSAFNHSMNYRSVVAYGRFEVVPAEEKPAVLAALMDHIAPGRQDGVREGSAKELAATTVLRVRLDEAAAKVRRGPPDDDAEDMNWPVWAGVLPLALVPGPAQADPACTITAPEHVQQWVRRGFSCP